MKKIRNGSLLMKIISAVPKALFFKTTDLYKWLQLDSGNCRMWIHSETRTWHDKNIQSNWSACCIPILWICRQLKHHQLNTRSEIFISPEIILNVFNVWQYHFRLKFLFWLYCHFCLFQFASSVNLLCC